MSLLPELPTKADAPVPPTAAGSTATERDAPDDGVDDAWYTGQSAYDGVECKGCGEDVAECLCIRDHDYPDECY